MPSFGWMLYDWGHWSAIDSVNRNLWETNTPSWLDNGYWRRCHNKDRCSWLTERGSLLKINFPPTSVKQLLLKKWLSNTAELDHVWRFFPPPLINTLSLKLFPPLHGCQGTWIISHIPTFMQILNSSSVCVYDLIRIWPCSLTLFIHTLTIFKK